MSSASEDVGVPVSVCPPRSEVEKIFYDRSYGEEVAKKLWISCLASEYRALQLAKLGVKLVQVETKSIAMPTAKPVDVSPIYKAIRSAKRQHAGIDEVSPHVARAYAEKNPDHLLAATRKLCELVKGGDEYVAIWVYPVNVKPLGLSREDAERVEQLANKVLEVLAPLGGAAEAALLTLIASGYRRGVTETIAGIPPEAKKFLEELLDKPFERAALLHAYKKLVGTRNLMHRVLRSTLSPDTGRHSILRGWIPVPEKINL